MSKKYNTQNLKPFKKGKDPRRHMTGPPPKLPEITHLLDKVLGTEVDGLSGAERILLALQEKAESGDVRAAEVLMNRSYGMPKQTINQNNTGEQTFIIKRTIHKKPDA